jgi:hypothetical protein
MISIFEKLTLDLVPYAIDRYGSGNLVASKSDLERKAIVIGRHTA